MTKLIAGCIFFRESPSWLAATAASLKLLGVDHLVALDGAFSIFGGLETSGGMVESQSIAAVCDALGIGYTLHVPNDRYMGNEPEKRNLLFKIMSAMSTPNDWSFIIDADEVVREVHPVMDFEAGTSMSVKQALATTDLDVASCHRFERVDAHDSPLNSMISRSYMVEDSDTISTKRFFRLLPDIRVEGAHYVYLAGQGDDRKVLWNAGETGGFKEVPHLELDSAVIIEHRQALRDKKRHKEKWDYYHERDRLGVEVNPLASVEK